MRKKKIIVIIIIIIIIIITRPQYFQFLTKSQELIKPVCSTGNGCSGEWRSGTHVDHVCHR